MSRFSKFSDKQTYSGDSTQNFMGGTSYELSPLQTLKIVAASSIFGEPQYYRDGEGSQKTIENYSTLMENSIFSHLFADNKSAPEIFTAAIDSSLDYDFKGTLELALELRRDYFMRLNPAVIFIRASMHPSRVKFNEENPSFMKTLGKSIAYRPDDLTNQFDYYMYVNGSKNGLSSLVKRTWSEKLSEFSRYQLNKYKGKKLIDLVRISHAWSEDIDELMKTGSLKVLEAEQTWENLRSSGKSWEEILQTIEIPHMALLRNLRGIFTEIDDFSIARTVCEKLKAGVPSGKQFPFRYYSAYKAVVESKVNHRQLILDTLEECMDISISNMPKLKGITACLSDNSGSSWGAMTSEYGSMHVAEIANLSSLITAMQSEEGFVGVFGDRLSLKEISKRNGLLTQLEETSERGRDQGGSTENGIWLFWKRAIDRKIHYDNVFIYSDMQAGHGGLYGENPEEYKDYTHGKRNIDVLSLVEKYRQVVNPKVNVFSVQVAGYDNSVLPENLYRGAILTGWTGKEAHYADALINVWNQIESK